MFLFMLLGICLPLWSMDKPVQQFSLSMEDLNNKNLVFNFVHYTHPHDPHTIHVHVIKTENEKELMQLLMIMYSRVQVVGIGKLSFNLE